jgi:hypothetical protein
MKKSKLIPIKRLGIFMLVLFSLGLHAQNSMQVIHNSPGAPEVDVYFNEIQINSSPIGYRQSTDNYAGFDGVNTVQLAIAGTNPPEYIYTGLVTLTGGFDYRAIATGIVGSTTQGQEFAVTYSSIDFSLPGIFNTNLSIYHSSPDAPTVGVVARGVTTLVSAFSYKDPAVNTQVPAEKYIIDVNAGSATGTTVKSYILDLSTSGDKNIAVIAGGLFSGKPAFGLYAIDQDGQRIDAKEMAKVQVIHNSPGAPAVDVWINGSTVAGGVVFRKASGFLQVDPTIPTTVQIAVTGSDPYNIVSTDIITLTSGISYRAIATGVVGSSVVGQEFDVTYHEATTTTSGGNTGLDIYHSSPDAPTVGVVARGVATLVNAFSFKDAATHVSVPSSNYVLDIRAGSASGSLVTSFSAPLAGFAGKNIAVLASGLLNGTPAFGLVAITEDGSEIVLPEPDPAKVQVIHNSPGAPAVDVWVNGTTVLSGVTYRQASGFLNVGISTFPTTVQIAVTGSSPYNIVSTDILTLTSGVSYRAIATGVVGSTVSGQEFDVTYFGATTTTTTGNTGLDIYHSSPNAPAVGVVAKDVATLVESFTFKSASYVSVPSNSYTININATNASGSTLFAYTAPLAGFINQNIAVIAGGMVGEGTTTGFGLYAVDFSGNVVVLPVVETASPTTTGVSLASTSEVSVFPNPASESINVVYVGGLVTEFELVNVLGATTTFAGNSADISALSKGLYVLKAYSKGQLLAVKKVFVQ